MRQPNIHRQSGGTIIFFLGMVVEQTFNLISTAPVMRWELICIYSNLVHSVTLQMPPGV